LIQRTSFRDHGTCREFSVINAKITRICGNHYGFADWGRTIGRSGATDAWDCHLAFMSFWPLTSTVPVILTARIAGRHGQPRRVVYKETSASHSVALIRTDIHISRPQCPSRSLLSEVD
jgi:hypothetical protein